MASPKRVAEIYEVLGVEEGIFQVRMMLEEFLPSDEGDWGMQNWDVKPFEVHSVLSETDTSTELDVWYGPHEYGKTFRATWLYPWQPVDGLLISDTYGDDLDRMVLQATPAPLLKHWQEIAL